ncbi:MAG TPA: aldehyde ferredoxin oxidoreductase C-terminal domain-containing protein [Syntrophales bacterium]|nr:aldehyde ferredoxin oxidoreductase C-terminal domain-containing protein [Syntrophales bacterium]
MKYTKSNLTRGYANQTLTIDLGSGAINMSSLDPRARDYFVGGRALGLYFLYKQIKPNTSPYDLYNPLIFSPGPLAGIPQFPGTSKCMAVSLSPHTGIPGITNFGGHFGAHVKYAGFDIIQVIGKSEKDVFILIDGLANEVKIIDAPRIDHVFDLEKFIADKFTQQGYDKKNITFVTTGIGAANTTYGCINSHYYDPTKTADGLKGFFRTKQGGRTGLGSVMNDKKLRSVIVLAEFPHGENPYGAADWEKARKAGSRLSKVVKEVDPVSLKMHRKGSAGLISFMNKENYQSLPVNNYQYGSDPRAEQISGKYYAANLFDHRGMDGCFPGCNLRCTKGGWVTLSVGDQAGRKVWVDGPEYETASGFGSNLGIWNAEAIMEANWHCDNYGIDTITTAVIIAFLMECFQRGYLVKEDTEGFELKWGDEKAMLAFVHQIAKGETEFAREAGRGMLSLIKWVSSRYMKRTGNANPEKELLKFAMQTKGLPFSLYRTHRSLSMQASYAAASDIGAHHAAAWLIKADLLGAFPTLKDRAKALVTYPRVRLGNDNLGLCKLPWVDVFNPESENVKDTDKYINPASQEMYAEFYNGVLGTNLTWEKIYEQTDHDINLQRIMNAMIFGKSTGDNDWVPERAIGPTDDDLYDAEKDFHDQEVSRISGKPPEEVQKMATTEKRKLLMDFRKDQLRKLIQTYYSERGWSSTGIPKVETLKQIGLWDFLNEETQAKIMDLNS